MLNLSPEVSCRAAMSCRKFERRPVNASASSCELRRLVRTFGDMHETIAESFVRYSFRMRCRTSLSTSTARGSTDPSWYTRDGKLSTLEVGPTRTAWDGFRRLESLCSQPASD